LPLVIWLLASPILASAAEPATELERRIEAIIDGPDYRHATWGILIVDAASGATIYARNPEAMLAPASVTKLFTCAAALIALGPDAVAETAVYQRGVAIKGTLRGDVILYAAGDLTFGGRLKDGKTVFKDKDHTYANSGLGDAELTDTNPLAALDDLARQIRNAGITQIDGEVLIEDRLFTRTRSSGSGPEAVSPVLLNDNVIDIIIEPGAKEGDPAKVTARPESAFYHMDAEVTTGAEDVAASVQLLSVGVNQFAVRGKIPARGKPVVRIYPIEEPGMFARTAFIEALRRQGVRCNAALLRPSSLNLPAKGAYDSLPKLASFTSPPFQDAITVTLKVSHNLYASTLPCLVAASRGFASAEDGLREERKILKGLGVDVDQVSFGGGAGGAPADHVTARATVQLLLGMSKRREWPVYKAALPVLGVDGTLAEVVAKSSHARGKVHAKTGTLVWRDTANDRFILRSKALAGTMTTKSGRDLLFAIFVNNVPLPAGESPSRDGKVLGKLCEVIFSAGG
jgi:D-alanyl-D-alanine carboxypeptidase/D-alanyl-D-alanine-endopeptidase (penicillin-binding protein 4)